MAPSTGDLGANLRPGDGDSRGRWSGLMMSETGSKMVGGWEERVCRARSQGPGDSQKESSRYRDVWWLNPGFSESEDTRRGPGGSSGVGGWEDAEVVESRDCRAGGGRLSGARGGGRAEQGSCRPHAG